MPFHTLTNLYQHMTSISDGQLSLTMERPLVPFPPYNLCIPSSITARTAHSHQGIGPPNHSHSIAHSLPHLDTGWYVVVGKLVVDGRGSTPHTLLTRRTPLHKQCIFITLTMQQGMCATPSPGLQHPPAWRRPHNAYCVTLMDSMVA